MNIFKKSVMSFAAVIAASLLLQDVQAYDLKNPALTPVEIRKAEKHAPIQLVKNGQLQFAIIADLDRETGAVRSRSISYAVDELKTGFQSCTGKTPEVFPSSQIALARKKYPFVISVGDNPISAKYVNVKKLKQEGFEVVTFPGGVVIAGTDSSLDPSYNKDPLDMKGGIRGTLWGSYDFMERIMGIRYYMPGTGTIFPAIRDLTLTPFRYYDYPRLPGRNGIFFINCTMLPSTKNSYRKAGWVEDWIPYLGNSLNIKWADLMNNRWRMGQVNPPFGGHDPHDKKFAKKHPDKLETIFYRSPNGNFYYEPHELVGSYYDVVDLKFADILIDSWKRYFASKGKDNDGWSWANNQYVSFGVTDHRITLADVEIDPVVRKLNLVTDADKKRGAPLANVYARFLQYLDKRLQQELPGVKLAVMAYYDIQHASRDPRWKLSKNVEVRYCEGAFPRLVHNKAEWAKVEQGLKDWENATGNPVRSIWAYNHNTNVYSRAMIGQMMGESIKKWGNLEQRDQVFFDHGGHYDFWNHFPTKYVMYRSMWNPDFNCDAAIYEMFTILYGKKSADILIQFQRLLKKTYIDISSKQQDGDILPPLAVVNQMEKLLNQAEAALPAGNERAKKHFQLYKKLWPGAFQGTRNRYSFERVTYNVYQLLRKEKIVVDGEAEPLWTKIKPMKMICPNGTGKKFKYPADIRLVWNKQGIYGFITMPYKPEAKFPAMWRNDTVEMFFAPGLKKEKYFHLVFDAYMKHIENKAVLNPIPMPYGKWLAAGYQLKTKVRNNSWTAEFFIPFAAMDVPVPKAYDSWLANLVTNKMTMPAEYSGTSLTLNKNHDVEKYSIIKFAGKGDLGK